MIDSGYFEGAYINERTREIVLSKHSVESSTKANGSQKQTRIVACKSCGANNAIAIGNTNECEYCGSPLE
jgi:DNA-directed RNA polymerase subunit RPC12/RpoP